MTRGRCARRHTSCRAVGVLQQAAQNLKRESRGHGSEAVQAATAGVGPAVAAGQQPQEVGSRTDFAVTDDIRQRVGIFRSGALATLDIGSAG
jgi:hypothetical protein